MPEVEVGSPDEWRFENQMLSRSQPVRGGLLTRIFVKLLGAGGERLAVQAMFAVAIFFFLLSGIILWLTW